MQNEKKKKIAIRIDDVGGDSVTGDSETRNLDGHSLPFGPTEPTISADPRHPERPVPPGTITGRYFYRLRKRLGEGSFGQVFLADCMTIDSELPAPASQVALKFFSNPGVEDCSRLMHRELAALLAMRHERILPVYDWSSGGEWPFVAFHYFPHGSLRDEINRVGPIGQERGWRLLTHLLSALVVAHRACILHLDIKPGNVLLDGKGGYVLADFGISQGHMIPEGMVDTGLGAPVYQSPEQARWDHKAFDARSDLWGVGITVWSACAGLQAKHLRPYLLTNRESPHGVPPLRSVAPAYTPDFEKLVMSLLRRNQYERPGSAAEVLVQAEGGSGDIEVNWPSLEDPRATRQANLRETAEIARRLIDPLWSSICGCPEMQRLFAHFRDGELLCADGDRSYFAFVLLSGKVLVERNGRIIAEEAREGAFIGELTALTGRTRTASLRAAGEVWVMVFGSAEFERFVVGHPPVAIRLIKTLADRLCNVIESSE